ncbi:MAG TPA: DUF192 domain-containing protein [Thermoanaerobaculaceae bacterium]|nr:DUF192 domain-containing protein [Thermoanaerobaculaceae bacterium]
MLTAALALAAATATPQPVCVVPDGTTVRLELALTDEERAQGLMFRDTLGADSGMLFIFEADSPVPFWMKNTFIPLDLIWLSSAGEVVDVRAEVQPCKGDPCPSYEPTRPGRAVLEVNGGFAARHGVRPGAMLRFRDVPAFPVPGGTR